jgi:hypothetical protein
VAGAADTPVDAIVDAEDAAVDDVIGAVDFLVLSVGVDALMTNGNVAEEVTDVETVDEFVLISVVGVLVNKETNCGCGCAETDGTETVDDDAPDARVPVLLLVLIFSPLKTETQYTNSV